MIIGREISRDRGELWLATSQRVTGLLAGCAPGDMAGPVPAMPGRTVRDLLALLVATAADALDGQIHATYAAREPGGSDALAAGTNAKLIVDAEPFSGGAPVAGTDAELIPAPEPFSSGAPVAGTDAELIAAWDAQAAGVASLVRDEPRASRLLIDLVTHEHDLRGALECPGARADDAVVIAVELLASEFAARLRAAGAPALRMTCEQWGYETAPPPCHAILVADRFELFRGCTGRRSAAEVRRWMWSTDPGPYLPFMSCTGSLRPTDLDEPDPDVPPEYAERLRTRSWREPAG
jgi:hypothetical protein